MAKQIFICEYCGKFNFPFRNENKMVVENHEVNCNYNPTNKSCDTCYHYRNYEKTTANFKSGWWCQLERQSSYKDRNEKNDLENYYNTGCGNKSNCSNWKEL